MTAGQQLVRFVRANPDVCVRLLELSLAWQRARPGRQGIASLYERLRWDEIVDTSGDPFRLCNTYRAYFARLLMHVEPRLDGVFDLRPSEADLFGHPQQPALFDDEHHDGGWLDEAAAIVRQEMARGR